MDKELIAEWFKFAEDDVDQNFDRLLPQCSYLKQFGVQPRYPKELDISEVKAVKFILEVKDFTVIAKLREIIRA